VSTLNVDKVDPSTGTDLEIGTSGDTITVPTGAGLTVTDEVKTNKVSPATGTAFALGDSGDTFTVPSGATIVNSGTATGFGITSSSFLPTAAPLIMNGNMAMAQRNSSVTGNTTGGYTTVDRMQTQIAGIGTWTIAQETLTSGAAFDAGFLTAFRMDCTTADASPAASDYLLFKYSIEGQDVQMFKKGTSNAEAYTLAFWVKSNKTGTAQVNMQDDNTRMCSATYTISSGDTWEHKVLNFAADTSGAIDNDSTAGLKMDFWLDAGSNYTGGTAPTAWEARVNTDESANDLALADNTANDWAITGLQLEVGTYTSADLPPFRSETYAANLFRCQRYYLATDEGTYKWLFGVKGFAASTSALVGAHFTTPAPLRATPTITVTGSTWRADDGASGYTMSGIASSVLGPIDNSRIGFTFTFSATPLTTYRSYLVDSGSGSGRVELSAEL
jgi:hypothetical protein